MSKATNRARQVQLLFVAVAAVGLSAQGTPVAAQNQQRVYKPGDMVEDGSGYVRKILRCDGQGEWDECEYQAYLDGKPTGSSTGRMTIRNLRAGEERARPPQKRESQSSTETTGKSNNAVAGNRPAPVAKTRPAGADKAGADCSYEVPGPSVSSQSKFSEALAKRKIYDEYARKANGALSAPLKVGVVFLSFQMGAPYKNTVANVPGYGAQRKHGGAPAGATIYAFKSKRLVCEQYRDGVTRRLVEGSSACFIDRDGAWTCPGENDTKIIRLDQ